MMRTARLLLVLLLAFAASCEGNTYVVSKVFCLRTGAEATVRIRLPRDSRISQNTLRLVQKVLSEQQTVVDDDLRRLVLQYLVEITDLANSGSPGVKLYDSSVPITSANFWSPTPRYLKCANTGAYTIFGLEFALIPGALGKQEWEEATYDEFRAAALQWLR